MNSLDKIGIYRLCSIICLIVAVIYTFKTFIRLSDENKQMEEGKLKRYSDWKIRPMERFGSFYFLFILWAFAIKFYVESKW